MSKFKFADQLGFSPPIVFEEDVVSEEGITEIQTRNSSGKIKVDIKVLFRDTDGKIKITIPKKENELFLYVKNISNKETPKGVIPATLFRNSGLAYRDIEFLDISLGKNLRKFVEEDTTNNTYTIVTRLLNWFEIKDSTPEARVILHDLISDHVKEFPSDFVTETSSTLENFFELFTLCIELGFIDLSETAGYISDKVFVAFAKAIRDQKLGKERWDPTLKDKYDPLFLDGTKVKQGIIKAFESIGLDGIDNSGNPDANSNLGENEYLEGINNSLVKDLKEVVLWFKNLILEAISDKIDLVGEGIKHYNAYMVGFINGLIDFLASIVEAIGFIVGILNYDKRNVIVAALEKFIDEFGWDTVKAFIGKVFTDFVKFLGKESYEQTYNIGKIIPKILEITIDVIFIAKGGAKGLKKVADLAKDLPEIAAKANKSIDDLISSVIIRNIDKKVLDKLEKQGVTIEVNFKEIDKTINSNSILPTDKIEKILNEKTIVVKYRGLTLKSAPSKKTSVIDTFLKRIEDPKVLNSEYIRALKQERTLFRNNSAVFRSIDDWFDSNRSRFKDRDGALDFSKVQKTWSNNSSIKKSELNISQTKELAKFRAGDLFNKNIATGKLQLQFDGKVFDFDYLEHAGKGVRADNSKGFPFERKAKKSEFHDSEFDESRFNDSESKIIELMNEDIARLAEELKVPFEKIKVKGKIETTYDPCNVCKRELLLFQERFKANLEIVRPFFIDAEGVKQVVIGHADFNKLNL
jgi:hypothetical protein